MDNHTVPEYLDLIKRQLKTEEQLTSLLFQSETLVKLLLRQDLATYSSAELYNCLWILLDLTQRSIRLSETFQHATPMAPSHPPKETPD